MAKAALDRAPSFDVPRSVVDPIVRIQRGANTIFDALFYDVCVLKQDLRRNGWEIDADPNPPAARGRNSGLQESWLSAISDPEGSILVIDAARPPYISRRFASVPEFVAEAEL